MSELLTKEQVVDELRQRAAELTPHRGIYGGTQKLAQQIGYGKNIVARILSNNANLSAGFADAAGYEQIIMYRKKGKR